VFYENEKGICRCSLSSNSPLLAALDEFEFI
jgi:hypothetical protein